MPVPTETLWNTRKVSIVFACSSAALLASIVWMIKVDYARPWRTIQNNFTDLQASLAHFDVLGTQTPESLEDLAKAKAAVDGAQTRLNIQQERTKQLIEAVRGGIQSTQSDIAKQIVKQISGPHRSAYAAVARSIDPSFSEFIARQAAKPDPAALHDQLTSERDFTARLAELLEWFNLNSLETRSKEIRGQYARSEIVFKNLKSELNVVSAAYEEEKGLHGEDDPHTREAKERRDRLKAEFQKAKVDFEQLADRRKAIETQQKLLQSEVTQAAKALARLEKERNEAVKKYEEYSNTLHRGIFNMPLLDFAAPKGTGGRNEIKQVVLPDVRVEFNFLQSYATDRCMTCHVAIADKNFTKENLARRLEKAIGAANEELKRQGEPLLTQPLVAGREDLTAGQVGKSWRTLNDEQQETFFKQVVDQINVYQLRRDQPELNFGQPLLAHPDLDLYVSPGSPHAMSKMGCVVCHEGNGEETDFVLAAHTPKNHHEREEWKQKYYVNTAGIVPEFSFETAEHHWTRPMLPPKYSEAGCSKCHSQVADIAVYNGQPAAGRINEGQLLFTSLGCINCHLVEQFGTSRRVGPDLSHVGDKLTPGFMHNWIWFPTDFRPSTNMPHYFLQENNDSGSETAGGDTDPVLRTRTEVVALSEYLTRVSNGYSREAPPPDLWEPLKDESSEAVAAARDRGRRIFGSVGCLACHATLAYQPNDEKGVAGPSLGEKWIGDDLTIKLQRLVDAVQHGKARKLKQRAMKDAKDHGKDPTEVSLAKDAAAKAQLAIAPGDAQGDEIPLAAITEVFKTSWNGPRYDADAARKKALVVLKLEPDKDGSVTLTDEEQKLIEISDEAFAALSEFTHKRFEEMKYVDRVEYSMANFKNAYDTIFDPQTIEGPVFTRFAPELSSVGMKFASYEQAVAWLYDWLKNPRHYSDYTKMPRLRLIRGTFPIFKPDTGEATGETVDADEALDVAIYLSGLKENKEFSTQPFNAEESEGKKLADKRDEMIRNLLGGLNSAARSEAILDDKGGELTEQLVTKLTKPFGSEHEARAHVEGLNLEQRRWMFLGDKMVGHYGCYACHQIRGYETAARPGTELTTWGEKLLTQIDFAFFEPEFREQREHDPLFHDLYPKDREKLIRWTHTNPPEEVEHTLASFAWHKVRNPRIWDRHKAKGPYDKLKMPNFFFSDSQADALVTFLLSRKPARVNESIQVDYETGPPGMIARGRNLVRELNCVACHKIDENAAVMHQYIQQSDGTFDEVNAPPWLRGQGAKIQSNWLYGFLNNVEMLRPWLKVRMPSFHLTPEQSTQLVEYFFGLSQRESKWLEAHLAPVERHIDEARKRSGETTLAAATATQPAGGGDTSAENTAAGAQAGSDWFQQDSLTAIADALRRYAVRNRLVPASSADPAKAPPDEFAATHQQILHHAEFLQDVYQVSYPFTEPPLTAEPEKVADGETLFTELKCLSCHVFGDPAVPGANAAPSAPNLQLAHKRLRRDWVLSWLVSPGRLQPSTKMPNVFGENRNSAFAEYPAEAKASVEGRLINKGMIDDGPAQIEALVSFLYDAGEKKLNKVQPPETTQPATSEAAEEKKPDEGAGETVKKESAPESTKTQPAATEPAGTN